MTEQAGPEDADRIVVAGGGVGGLALALMLGRAGRRVTLVERDVLDGEPDPEAAFAATRRGVPQAHQTHGFLARLRLVLRDRLPDVLAEVEAAGAQTLALTTDLGEPRPGDDDLAVLIVRRTTLEWVLRRAVAAEARISLHTGTHAAGLIATPSAALPVGGNGDGDGDVAAVPHVVGVRSAGGEVLRGTVVACTGSRGDVPAWLGELGVTVPEDEHPTKLIYLTRWYRRPADQPPAPLGGRLFGDLGYLRYVVVPGDGGTLSATLAVHVRDAELRARLLDGDRFDRAVRRLPGPDRFFVPGTAPLGPVRPMAGLVNRLRRFADDRGEPLVTGFHAVGDAHTCTNPLYGRGCALAMVQAGLLADAFAAHPDDPRARALAYESASAREVEPWFHGAVQMDTLREKLEARNARGRAAGPLASPDPAVGAVAGGDGRPRAAVTGVGAPGREPGPNGSPATAVPGDRADAVMAEHGVGPAHPGSAAASSAGDGPGGGGVGRGRDQGASVAATIGRVMAEGGSDPVIGRAIIRLFNLLALPHELMADAELLARVAPLLARPPQAPAAPEGPSLAELLA